jgi:methylenetetrahydrofolate reductase (NADPH)
VSPSPPASGHKSPGNLEKVLRAGGFAVTAETTPPVSADPQAVLDRAGCLKGLADAVNVTDGAGAKSAMATLAAAAVLARDGIEPVLQMTCRDRNRLALQADLLGAAALGVPNILALRGDDVSAGDQPEAKQVFDLESTGILDTARRMRDESKLPSGRAVTSPPRLFLGAADAPFDPPADWTPGGLLAKIEAGADFVQTQYAFDLDILRRYMSRLADFGIPERLFILVGIGPLASAKSARWMDANLFGVTIPETLIARLDNAADQAAEGRRICSELIAEIREIPGVAGVHLMAPHQEAAAAQVIAESGVLSQRS